MARSFVLCLAASFVALAWLGRPASAHEFVDYFETGSTQLSPRGYRVAREVAAYAAQAPSRILITGHEDGYEAQSRADARLDLWRGRAMMLELMPLGVSPRMITVEAKGVTQMALARPDGVAEPLNRRVTLDVNRLPPVLTTPGAPRPPMRITEPYRPIIYFSSGQTAIGKSDEFTLRLATFALTRDNGRVIVHGHSDTLGTPEDNLALSVRRAESVAGALVRQGLAWDQIEIRASGETQLARASADDVGEPLNRRVVVDVLFNPVAH